MKHSTFLKSGSQAMLAGVAQQVFSMVQFLCIVRWLLPDALGVWAMFLTLSAIVEVARLGLVQNTLVYFGTHQAGEKPRIVAASLLLSVGISIVGALGLVILTFMLRGVWQMPDLPVLMLIYVVMAVLNAFLRFIEAYNMIDQSFKTAAISALIYGGVSLVLTFLVKLLTGCLTVYHLILIQIVAALVNLAVVGKSLMPILKEFKTQIDLSWVKRLFNYGRYGLGTNLTSMLFQRTDVIVLGAFVSPVGIAAYNVATRIITYIDFPLNSLGLAFLPKLSEAFKGENTEGVARQYEKSVGWLLAITLPLTLFVFIAAPFIVWVLAGENYTESVPLLQILALLGLVKPWGRLFGVLLDAIGKPQLNFKMLFLSMTVTVLFNIALIPFYGIQGAAWATGLAVLTTISTGQIMLARWLPVKSLNAFKHILPVYQQIGGIVKRFLFKKLETLANVRGTFKVPRT